MAPRAGPTANATSATTARMPRIKRCEGQYRSFNFAGRAHVGLPGRIDVFLVPPRDFGNQPLLLGIQIEVASQPVYRIVRVDRSGVMTWRVTTLIGRPLSLFTVPGAGFSAHRLANCRSPAVSSDRRTR